MALIYNGVTIPSNATVNYNGTSLQKIIYNGVTVWQKQIYFSFSNGYAYCQKAGTYTFTLTARGTAGVVSSWHGSIYVNNKHNFSCDNKQGTLSKIITLSKGDYIHCNSPASGSTNGYLTLIIK